MEGMGVDKISRRFSQKGVEKGEPLGAQFPRPRQRRPSRLGMGPWSGCSCLGTKPLWPGDSPGKNTGVGCHALLLGTVLTQGLC